MLNIILMIIKIIIINIVKNKGNNDDVCINKDYDNENENDNKMRKRYFIGMSGGNVSNRNIR